MGWFDEQIKVRINKDKEAFENSFIDLSSVVLGESFSSESINNKRLKTKSAIEEILKYYKSQIVELPLGIDDTNEQIEYLLRPTGIMYRKVELKGNWWKDAIGPMLGQTKEGDAVALLPFGFRGYRFYDYSKGKYIKLNKKTKLLLDDEAFCFYKPLPLKPLKIYDLMLYILSTLTRTDIIAIIVATGIVTAIGLLSPWVTREIYSKVVPSKEMSLLLPVMFLYLGVEISKTLINITKSMVTNMTQSKMDMAVSSAAMSRLMSLPADFFKNYSSGELATRTFKINQLCSMLANVFLTTGLSSIFSFAYVFQLGAYTPSLVIPSLIIIFVQLIFMIFSTFISLDISRRKMTLSSKLDGLVFALFSGIQKIKLSGSEKRAFSKWANSYKEVAKLEYNPPWIIKVMPILSTIISSAGLLIIYFAASMANVNQADYMAFNMAYGQVSGAILALASIVSTVANIKPVMELVEPVLKAQPEISQNKKILTKISGGIEVNNLTFRYSKSTPLILDGINLKIEPGQYIAIVGRTGCGKSTLMRLLLGFETPEKGAIYYDGLDIKSIDLKFLRQNIGVVMQNGKVFSGDIYSNIVISAPWLNQDAAWEAAEMAGFAKDIKDMPMGMHTIISEGSGSISGGQKQRLMIARAIAPKPKILMFDEATSALDNITQKQVSDSLNSLRSTRIVIAHRLSTIKQCDRIVVLDKGKIIEDGTYNELILKKGYFAELVERQRIGEKI